MVKRGILIGSLSDLNLAIQTAKVDLSQTNVYNLCFFFFGGGGESKENSFLLNRNLSLGVWPNVSRTFAKVAKKCLYFIFALVVQTCLPITTIISSFSYISLLQRNLR